MLTRGRERDILSGGKNERDRAGNEHISVLLLLHMFMFWWLVLLLPGAMVLMCMV